MQSSLIIQTSFIGDVILTTPLIEELSQRGPVDVVTTKVGASILKSDPRIRHLHIYDKRGRDSGISGLLRFSRSVRKHLQNESTTAYLAQGSLRSAALALLSGCKERVGFDTSGGKMLYTKKVVYNPQIHHSQRLLDLDGPRHEASDNSPTTPGLYPTASDIDAVNALLGDVNNTRGLIALAPGSVWATKRWPFYPRLASLIAERNTNSDITDAYDIVLIGGKEDQHLGEEIEAEVARVNNSEPENGLHEKARVINAIGKLSLLGSAELIRRCDIILTNDSSPQHLASAMNTKTFTIFGPTVPEFGFGPLADGSKVVENVGLSCRPCDKHGPQKCPLKHWKCMRDLSPQSVIEAIFNTGI